MEEQRNVKKEARIFFIYRKVELFFHFSFIEKYLELFFHSPGFGIILARLDISLTQEVE